MTISLENIGKRFNREWIFKNLTASIKPNSSVAITGPNGSGKSTLIQIIAGSLLPSTGQVTYLNTQQTIPGEKMYQHISFCAPYLDIIEEFTLEEFLRFHFKFKKLTSSRPIDELPTSMQLDHAKSKKIKDFSTGMKQRVKLGICFFSDAPIVLLDEPTTNLDSSGFEWYQHQINELLDHKTLIVSSNNQREFAFCRTNIDIRDYKR